MINPPGGGFFFRQRVRLLVPRAEGRRGDSSLGRAGKTHAVEMSRSPKHDAAQLTSIRGQLYPHRGTGRRTIDQSLIKPSCLYFSRYLSFIALWRLPRSICRPSMKAIFTSVVISSGSPVVTISVADLPFSSEPSD